MKSIKLKVAMIANIMAVICLLILGIVTFIFVKQSLFDEIVNSEKNRLISTNNLVENFRESTSNSLLKLSETILRNPYSNLNSQEALAQNVGVQLKAFRDAGNYLAVYIAQPDGELVVSDPDSDSKNIDYGFYGKADGYDARTREFYIEARKKNGLFITASYIDATTGLPCFTYAMPLNKDGKFVGILAIDVLVKDLIENLKQMPGDSFVYDKNRYAFASTHKNYTGNHPNISTIADAFSKTKNNEPFFYTSAEGNERLALCNNSNDYTVCNVAYVDTINNSSEKIAYIQAIIVIFTSILSVVLLYFIVSRYLSPLEKIQTGLNSFFDFINHKTKDSAMINVNTNDEFGVIAKAINENITKTKNALEQDAKAVEQSVETAKEIEAGNLTARITAIPANPQLIELKNVLNDMLSVLEEKVGSNMNEINRVFDSYKALDFTTEVANAKGGVEITTNVLGQEIVAMLRQSSEFANLLATQSGKLQSAVRELTDSSSSQASSLEETAAA
ncbi:methyl-accepting chemotaxis protein, partial [Campylobacter lari]|nr:methyl-accepting chemotaxis protein [Campylobacter lari]